jgi:hypothetical protein
VTTAVAALVLAGALAIVPAASGGDRSGWLRGLAAIGFLAVVIAIARWAEATWWGVIALGAEYTVLRIGRGPVDIGAAYVATGLFLLAELVLWSLDARSRVVEEPDATRRRGIRLGLLSLGALVLGSLVVAAGRLARGEGLTRTFAGVLGSVAILAIVARVVAPVRAPGDRAQREGG